MPRGCLYPQDLNEVEILDDGTLNPKRCPYRTRWKPYLTSANHLCCQKHYVGKHNRANSRDRWTPKTHINFLDDRRPPNRPPKKPHQITWLSNQRCPEGVQCQKGGCEPKNGKPRVCSDKHRCVLEGGAAWLRSGCKQETEEKKLSPCRLNQTIQQCWEQPNCKYGCTELDEGETQADLKYSFGDAKYDDPIEDFGEDDKVSEYSDGEIDYSDLSIPVPGEIDYKDTIVPLPVDLADIDVKEAVLTQCTEFPELGEDEPEPKGWCPSGRCYRHTEAGKRVCLSPLPPLPLPPSPLSIGDKVDTVDEDREEDDMEEGLSDFSVSSQEDESGDESDTSLDSIF